MPLEQYGVLVGTPVDATPAVLNSPHYQVKVIADSTEYRLAINVRSRHHPSEVLYLVEERFSHPILAEVCMLKPGWHNLDSRPNTVALDYIRSNLFDAITMQPLPFDLPGADNDLNEKVGYYVERAILDTDAVIYAFGERFGPEPKNRDAIFGFLPGNGVHDIHMNQGNTRPHEGDDGVYQDGGIILHFPNENQWVAIFLAFQSQTWHTNDNTGHAEPGFEPGLPNAPQTTPSVPHVDSQYHRKGYLPGGLGHLR